MITNDYKILGTSALPVYHRPVVGLLYIIFIQMYKLIEQPLSALFSVLWHRKRKMKYTH